MAPPTSSPTTPAPDIPPSKPDWLPANYWADGKIADSFGADYATMAARVAAEDVRRATLPDSPDKYEVKLPADFKMPEGLSYQIDDKSPLIPQLRQLVFDVDHGKVSGQEAMSRGLALLAGNAAQERARVDAFFSDAMTKLGASGPVRLDAADRFFKAYLGETDGKMLMNAMGNAVALPLLEKMISKITGEGKGSFTATGREPPQAPGRVPEDVYSKWSADEKMAYARQFDQSKMPAWRDPRH